MAAATGLYLFRVAPGNNAERALITPSLGLRKGFIKDKTFLRAASKVHYVTFYLYVKKPLIIVCIWPSGAVWVQSFYCFEAKSRCFAKVGHVTEKLSCCELVGSEHTFGSVKVCDLPLPQSVLVSFLCSESSFADVKCDKFS